MQSPRITPVKQDFTHSISHRIVIFYDYVKLFEKVFLFLFNIAFRMAGRRRSA